MFGEMRTAALLDRALLSETRALTPHDFLEMATINGAKALGIQDITGSLQVGKAADITAVKIRNYPVYDPAHNLVFVGTDRYGTHSHADARHGLWGSCADGTWACLIESRMSGLLESHCWWTSN
jgi:cytosine/adenosine deaminase-related metal-dependent hydrolase